jgi:hypothetical protein
MELIIEEISRGHKLLSRQKFSQSSVHIGRGYQNDIIVSDPHVCSEHLHLQFDGDDWLASDQGSVNGSFLEQNKQPIMQYKVQSGDVISIGKSQVRLVFPEHPVEESITVSPFENLINLARNPVILALSILLFTFIAGWIVNLNNAKDVTLTQMLVPAIGLTLGFALWPAAVSVVSHLTKHDARFWGQVGICFIFFNLMWLSDFFENIVNFNTSSNMPFIWLMAIIPLALAFALFWLNCYIGFHMTARRRNVMSVGFVVLLFGGSFIVQMSKKPEFSARPHFSTTIMTPSFLFASSSSVDKFVEDSSELFAKAKKVASEDKK